MFQIGLKKFLLLKKLKILFCGHVFSNLNGEEIFGTFRKNELKKNTNSKKRSSELNYMESQMERPR